MTAAGLLLAASLALPLAMLAASPWPRGRRAVEPWLAAAPLPALAAALLARGGSFALPGPFRLTLSLDLPGAILLGAAALIWIAGALFAGGFWERAERRRAVPWWLMTLAGSLGVFMAADMASFYLTFSLVSLSAYGLVAFDGHSAARRVGALYVAFAVLGEAFLILAFVMMSAAAPHGSLAIADAVAALPGSPWRDTTILLLILGFGAKIALVPLHVWMPPSYTAAPIPAAAVLSGAAVKAGIIGFLRFLPFDAGLAGWGHALAAATRVLEESYGRT